MAFENLRIVLKKLDEHEAEVCLFSDKGMSGHVRLNHFDGAWQTPAEFSHDQQMVVSMSLFGPNNTGPEIMLPQEAETRIIVTRFIPGNSHELCGTIKMTCPDCESNPQQLCCLDGKLCQPPELYPAELETICQLLTKLRAENDGLPIVIIDPLLRCLPIPF